jgi:hypothetical protein
MKWAAKSVPRIPTVAVGVLRRKASRLPRLPISPVTVDGQNAVVVRFLHRRGRRS